MREELAVQQPRRISPALSRRTAAYLRLPAIGMGKNKKSIAESDALFWYWVGESNSYCEIENLEY